MTNTAKRIAILASGGDTPGMNAATYYLYKTAKSYGMTVLGVRKGYTGLIEGRIEELRDDDIEGILGTGGTMLKTSRCEEMRTPEGQAKAVEVAKAFDIDTLVVLGGDGSYMGAKQLDSLGVPTIGLPGTIDNDLGYTDYTIGFDTAVNGVIGEMDKIRDTMSSHERIGVIEVMGNHCGDIALDAPITGGAEYAIVPEEPFDIDEIGASLKRRRIQGQKTCLIVIAEGAGKGEAIANYLGAKTGFDVKSIKLGYVQRGGHPTVFDRMLASRMSLHAIKLISEGVSSRAVGIKDNKIIDMDLAEAVAVKNVFDKELYEFHKSLW